VAQRLQQAWLAFHDGQFREAIDAGRALGTLGAAVAGKAAAVHSLSQASDDSRVIKLLEEAAARGESAVAELPGYANAHYTLALVLGRYSQRISIVHALAEGLASRVRTHLDRTLEVEPRHAEAHIALGLYHAEIVAQLGSLAARFTYGATAEAALGHFREALALTPHSPIALMEYAHGLLRLDAGKHRTQARTLLQRAARCSPLDAMERLDRDRAHEELARL
jgi:tetratricopeptide (TPR) repeat protein